MTAQQTADAALVAWRDKRAAERRGDHDSARAHEAELERLLG